MYACRKISILAAAALLLGCGHYLIPGRFQPLEVAQQQTNIQGSSMKILDDGTVTFVQNRLEVSVRPMTDEELNRQFPAQSTNASGPADELPSNPFHLWQLDRSAHGQRHRSACPSSRSRSKTTNTPRSSSIR